MSYHFLCQVCRYFFQRSGVAFLCWLVPALVWAAGPGNTTTGVKAGDSLGTKASYNTLTGYSSGYSIVQGEHNTATGALSSYISTGSFNTTAGYQSCYNNKSSYNVCYGSQSGFSNVNGTENVFIGYQSGYHATSSYNVHIGVASGYRDQGGYNTFVGYHSGYSNTTGSYCYFYGAYSGYNNTTGGSNHFYGAYSGYNNTTGAKNTFAGKDSGYANKNGNENTFFGYQSGYSNTSGSENTLIGSQSGYTSLTKQQNTYVGYRAGYTAKANSATLIGVQSGTSNEGAQQVCFGFHSGFNNTSGEHNLFVGHRSGQGNVTGRQNTILGSSGGYSNKAGSHNVFLGYNAGYQETGSNKLYIASSNTRTPLIYGDFSAATVTIHGSLKQTSDRRLKQDIQTIQQALRLLKQIRGVRFRWKQSKGTNVPKGRHIGLIAQEVQRVLPEVVLNDGPYKAVSYSNLVAVLIAGIQEQQRMIQKEQVANKQHATDIAQVERRIAQLSKQIAAYQSLEQQLNDTLSLLQKKATPRAPETPKNPERQP